jgi:hypothetical protein
VVHERSFVAYRLHRNFIWESHHTIPEDIVLVDSQGRVRLIMEESGRITVTRDYAWNGCTPKVCIFDINLGTPDGVVHRDTERPKTYFASLVHDALYQFLPEGLPLKRRHADRFFLQLMKESEFGPRWVYWAAVRLFGGISRRITRTWRQTSGTKWRESELLESSTGSPAGSGNSALPLR